MSDGSAPALAIVFGVGLTVALVAVFAWSQPKRNWDEPRGREPIASMRVSPEMHLPQEPDAASVVLHWEVLKLTTPTGQQTIMRAAK